MKSYPRRLLIELPKASTADDYDALLPWSIGIAANRSPLKRGAITSSSHWQERGLLIAYDGLD